MDLDTVRDMLSQSVAIAQIARATDLSRQSVYRKRTTRGRRGHACKLATLTSKNHQQNPPRRHAARLTGALFRSTLPKASQTQTPRVTIVARFRKFEMRP
jgi:hypothetical protein